jgi:hypothetical protein
MANLQVSFFLNMSSAPLEFTRPDLGAEQVLKFSFRAGFQNQDIFPGTG